MNVTFRSARLRRRSGLLAAKMREIPTPLSFAKRSTFSMLSASRNCAFKTATRKPLHRSGWAALLTSLPVRQTHRPLY